jgi:hypothetical protein
VLPNLLVIGAAKCGTTSLHEHLNAHPEIAMSRENELDFFVDHYQHRSLSYPEMGSLEDASYARGLSP